MKKITSIVLALSLIIALSVVFVFVFHNNKLSGTYMNDTLQSITTYTFKDDSVTLTIESSLSKITYSGKYEIFKEDGETKIRFTFENNGSTPYTKTHTLEKVNINTIELSGIEYKKQK